MLKSKLELFVFKRVLIFYILLSILTLLFMNERWALFIGFSVGSFLSVSKFSRAVKVFMKLASVENTPFSKKIVLQFFLYFLLVSFFLMAAIRINQYLFYGFSAGILIVNTVIFLICLTGGIGLHNKDF